MKALSYLTLMSHLLLVHFRCAVWKEGAWTIHQLHRRQSHQLVPEHDSIYCGCCTRGPKCKSSWIDQLICYLTWAKLGTDFELLGSTLHIKANRFEANLDRIRPILSDKTLWFIWWAPPSSPYIRCCITISTCCSITLRRSTTQKCHLEKRRSIGMPIIVNTGWRTYLPLQQMLPTIASSVLITLLALNMTTKTWSTSTHTLLSIYTKLLKRWLLPGDLNIYRWDHKHLQMDIENFALLTNETIKVSLLSYLFSFVLLVL